MERIRCTSEIKQDCKYRLGVLGCHTSVHHEFWPKRDYQTPTEKRFRELDENKVRVCRNVHDAIHATTEPPQKPSHDEMAEALTYSRERDRVQLEAAEIIRGIHEATLVQTLPNTTHQTGSL